MILSPYRNPPYRTPTPKTDSPPPGPSPKRKRDDLSRLATPPRHIGAQSQHDHAPISGSGSPRANVAEQFKQLDIQQVRPTSLRRIERSGAPRKRLKRNAHVVDNSSSSDSYVVEPLESSEQHGHDSDRHSGVEVGETPNCRTRTIVATPQVPLEDTRAVRASSKSPVPSSELVQARVLNPRPSPSPSLDSPPDPHVVAERSVSPLPRADELTSDQAALTWQDDEITGHELDPGGDDDGEGINGIGFKPTPAIAHARQQKRKQQVNDWKTREAREARQRRLERRRGDSDELDVVNRVNLDEAAKRVVRFTGLG